MKKKCTFYLDPTLLFAAKERANSMDLTISNYIAYALEMLEKRAKMPLGIAPLNKDNAQEIESSTTYGEFHENLY